MKIHEQIYAIIDAETNEILVDGSGPWLRSTKPTDKEVNRVQLSSGRQVAVVRCYIVRAPMDTKGEE